MKKSNYNENNENFNIHVYSLNNQKRNAVK